MDITRFQENAPGKLIPIADLARRLEVTYPRANMDVERLVQAGILQALAGMQAQTYYAPDVFGVADDEVR